MIRNPNFAVFVGQGVKARLRVRRGAQDMRG